jgi:hypothetical protein
MRNVNSILVLLAAFFAITIAANKVAQKLYPTKTTDSWGDRYRYGVLVKLIGYAFIVVIGVIVVIFDR